MLCLLIHWVLSSNNTSEHQDILAMKNNYDDFSQNSLRESLNFPRKNKESIIQLNSLNVNMTNNNSSYNYAYKKP